jgi:hypothetical protein
MKHLRKPLLGQPGHDAYFGHDMLDVLRALTLR